MTDKVYVNLLSAEHERFTVPLKVAKMSKMISNSCDEDDDEITDKDFICPKVKTDVLEKVVEYCTHYQTVEKMNDISTPLNGETVEEIVKQDWYVNYCMVERKMLFELVAAANYMDIKPLLDLTCATVASMIKGKTPEEIRRTFNITNDFSPEEEAQVREENKWCEEA